MVSRSLLCNKSDDWSTPEGMKSALYDEFGLDFDPCELHGTDGLLRDWNGRAFVNPPYSDVRSWLDKALIEIRSGRCGVAVFLIPSRTGTRWFHEVVLPFASEIRWLRGRLKFGGAKTSAPFDSFVAVFTPTPPSPQTGAGFKLRPTCSDCGGDWYLDSGAIHPCSPQTGKRCIYCGMKIDGALDSYEGDGFGRLLHVACRPPRTGGS